MSGLRRAVSSAVAALAVLAAIAAGAPSPAAAQGGSDIFVVSLTERGSSLQVGTPRNVTARAGYDNQPQFTPDGAALLYTAISGNGPSDIFRVELASGTATRLTRTDVESEYSATPMPSGEGFSVIVVEPDSTQRLWAYGWDGAPLRPVFTALRPVGYHVWVGRSAVGMFVLGDPNPNALVLGNPLTQRADTLARNIGRAFARVPGREAFTFVHFHGDTAVLGEVDTRTAAVRRITPLPEGSEYHVWTPGGRLIIGNGSRLLVWTDGRWDTLADLAVHGVRGISRLAISPAGDRVAIVAEDAGRR